MPTYLADFVSRRGRRARQKIDAIDAASVESYIKEVLGGYHIAATETGPRYRNRRLKVPRKALLMALEAVTLLLEAGATVDVAFRATVSRVPPGKLRYMLAEIARRLEARGEVAKAFAEFPRMFPPVVTGLIEASERSGTLVIRSSEPNAQRKGGFAEVCDYFRGMEEIRSDVIRGLFIPAIGAIAGVASFAVIFGYSLPRFKKFVVEMVGPGDLNPLSALYFRISDFVVAHPALCILAVASVPVLIWQLWQLSVFRKLVFKVCSRMPILGRALEAVGLARICKTYATLAVAGFRASDTLEMCISVVGHELLAAGLVEVRDGVQNNRTVGEGFSKSKAFPHEFSTAVALAEHNLPAIFTRLGDFYSREAKNRINIAISALEPSMVVVLGLFALSAGLAMILPVISIINKMSGM